MQHSASNDAEQKVKVVPWLKVEGPRRPARIIEKNSQQMDGFEDVALGIQSPCQMMIGVYNHLLSKVSRFHYHCQKVIGSLGP